MDRIEDAVPEIPRAHFTLADICRRLPADVTPGDIDAWVVMMSRYFDWRVTFDVFRDVNHLAARRGPIIYPLIYSLLERILAAEQAGDVLIGRAPYQILGHIWEPPLLWSHYRDGRSLRDDLLHRHQQWKLAADRTAQLQSDFLLYCRFDWFPLDRALFVGPFEPAQARSICGTLLNELLDYVDNFRLELVELARSIYPESSAGPVELDQAAIDYYDQRGVDVSFARHNLGELD